MTTRDNCKYYALFTLERGMFVKFPIFLSFDSYTFDEKFSCRNINCPFTYIYFFLVYDFQQFAPKVEKSFACRILTFDGTKKKRKKKKQS